ncbi:MAG: twin-arginine translocase TatA/TatE family subunit [Acidobacteriaceae bacterium]
MPSFPDSIFLFVLALLLFGPKRLPVLARELGKWVGEFRRASNEFKMQMEEELRLSEQAEKTKQFAAMQAAAPVAPAIAESSAESSAITSGVDEVKVSETAVVEPVGVESSVGSETKAEYEVVDGVRTPLPIAVSGDLKIMPPRTGLPVAQDAGLGAGSGPRNSALKGLLDAIPAAEPEASVVATTEATETTAHGN